MVFRILQRGLKTWHSGLLDIMAFSYVDVGQAMGVDVVRRLEGSGRLDHSTEDGG